MLGRSASEIDIETVCVGSLCFYDGRCFKDAHKLSSAQLFPMEAPNTFSNANTVRG